MRLDGPVSLLVVAVKAYDLDEALGARRARALADAVVLPLLNGLEHVERIRACDELTQRPGRASVAAGSIGRVEAYAAEPGVVVQRDAGRARHGRGGRGSSRVDSTRALAPLRVPAIDVVVATASAQCSGRRRRASPCSPRRPSRRG